VKRLLNLSVLKQEKLKNLRKSVLRILSRKTTTFCKVLNWDYQP
jgi:hypothetical protein